MVEIDKKRLESMYNDDKMSIREIASELGASRGQIEHLMEVWNIPRRSYSKAQKVKAKKAREDDEDNPMSLFYYYEDDEDDFGF